MDYKNQLVLTGELNDVGSSIRKNVDDSYRMGIEFETAIQLNDQFHWMANATFSRNKIGNFQEVIYDYDNGGIIENDFDDSDISFSPAVIIGSQFTFKPTKNFEMALISKSVSKQYLDNTSNDARSIDAYFVNDFRLNWSINTNFLKDIDFSFLVNNALNETYESNGYTFSYVFGGMVTENYYYPQAGRNFFVGMKLRF
jgi:iron complex outermembrane receptor protein